MWQWSHRLRIALPITQALVRAGISESAARALAAEEVIGRDESDGKGPTWAHGGDVSAAAMCLGITISVWTYKGDGEWDVHHVGPEHMAQPVRSKGHMHVLFTKQPGHYDLLQPDAAAGQQPQSPQAQQQTRWHSSSPTALKQLKQHQQLAQQPAEQQQQQQPPKLQQLVQQQVKQPPPPQQQPKQQPQHKLLQQPGAGSEWQSSATRPSPRKAAPVAGRDLAWARSGTHTNMLSM